MPYTVVIEVPEQRTYLLWYDADGGGWSTLPVVLGASTDALERGVRTTVMRDRRAEQ